MLSQLLAVHTASLHLNVQYSSLCTEYNVLQLPALNEQFQYANITVNFHIHNLYCTRATERLGLWLAIITRPLK